MVSTNINFRIDSETKESAEAILDQLGISMSAALNMFLHQVVIRGGIPLDLYVEVPNKETIEAMEEGRRLMSEKDRKRCSTIEEVREELGL